MLGMALILRVDSKGRVTIPVEIRRRLGIKSVLKLEVKDGKIILQPCEDPLEEASRLVVNVSPKASVKPGELGEAASKQLEQELEKQA